MAAIPEMERIVSAMDRWSSSFWKLLLPSKLGTKSTIKEVIDEGAKVLSIGVYMGVRSGAVDAIPYDGSTYEGHTIEDESKGSLWMYETSFPSGFHPVDEREFIVSLGHVFKCHQCRGQGRVTCEKCKGKVRWTRQEGDKIVEYICSCGDGKMNCPTCTGFGQMLKVLRVNTNYRFYEEREKDYSGRLPAELLMDATGNTVFKHVCEFDKRVIAEAIDGFEPKEFDILMTDAHSELKREVDGKVVGQMINPKILHKLIDDYFKKLPNPVVNNKRLQQEVLPVRMKCEVTDVPVKAVKYEYKGKDYSLYCYSNNDIIWHEDKPPSEFTWKILTLLIIIGVIIVGGLFAILR